MLLIATLALVACQAPPRRAHADSGGLALHELQSGGLARYYRLHLPPADEPGAPAPLVLAFHGGGGNAVQFAESSGLTRAADERGFIAVFPEGSGALGGPPLFKLETWNAGNCCGYALEHAVDDVQFVRDLLDELARDWSIDAARVYATGMSNGGMMAYRLGAELPERFAAVAPVAAALGVRGEPACPIPLIAFHGAQDENVPPQGGVGSGVSGTDFASQADSLAPFLTVNGALLPAAPTRVVGQAQLFASLPAAGSARATDVHYWWLLDGGHSWPGHPPDWKPSEPTNSDIDASAVMLDFFLAHPLLARVPADSSGQR